MNLRLAFIANAAAVACVAVPAAVAQGTIIYKCPGNAYTSSQELNAKAAAERGCIALEGMPVTVVQGNRPRETRTPAPAASAARPADARVDPAEQRARDNDARRILENELRAEMERLAMLLKEYNNGEPERRGDERNYQKYLDRTAELKAGILRKESDIAALRRELAKLPQ